jgi:hypothetical protein
MTGFTAWRLVLLSGGIVLAAAGVGYATIPDSGHVYTGCMLKNVGTVRLIDTSLPAKNLMSHCTSLESVISWNQAGGAGTPGPQGAPGAPGATGAPGAPGATGDQGPSGLDSNDARVVTASDLQGLTLAQDGDNGDPPGNGHITFVASSDTPLGARALDLQTVTGKSVAVYLPATGTKGRLLSELTSFGYSSKIVSQPNPDYDVTAQIEVVGSTASHFASGYTTVVFEPYNNGEAGLTDWHRSDMVHGKVWSTQALPSGDCSQAVPCPFATFVAENPRATVLDAKFRIGQNSGTPATDAGEYLLDDVVYGFGTVVDFDLGG